VISDLVFVFFAFLPAIFPTIRESGFGTRSSGLVICDLVFVFFAFLPAIFPIMVKPWTKGWIRSRLGGTVRGRDGWIRNEADINRKWARKKAGFFWALFFLKEKCQTLRVDDSHQYKQKAGVENPKHELH
jgi:hypothetical protein